MELNKILLIIVVVFVLMAIASTTLLLKYFKDKGSCLQDPFVFGAKRFKATDNEINCYCYFIGNKYDPFYFNHNGTAYSLDEKDKPLSFA